MFRKFLIRTAYCCVASVSRVVYTARRSIGINGMRLNVLICLRPESRNVSQSRRECKLLYSTTESVGLWHCRSLPERQLQPLCLFYSSPPHWNFERLTDFFFFGGAVKLIVKRFARMLPTAMCNAAVEVLALLLRLRETTGSNLGSATGIPTEIFHGFSQFPV